MSDESRHSASEGHVGRNAPTRSLVVYVPHFLTVSMTFIYRQLLGARRNFDVAVVCTTSDNRDRFPFDPVEVVSEAPVDRIVRGVFRRLRGSVKQIGPLQSRRLEEVLRQRGADLVHAHFGPSGLDMLPIARRMQLPLVVTFHGYDASELLRNRTYVEGLRELFEYAHLITISRRMAGQLIELGAKPSSITTHYIGVPLQSFAFVERRPVAEKIRSGEPVQLLQVANFVEKKGHRDTVEAFARFVHDVPQARLTLAGDGPHREGIVRRVEELGLSEFVRFPGKVGEAEVAQLMRQADVFVHHSVTASNGDQEGIPTVLMEAMATGLVAVSTHHAGIAELVEDGRTGYLVEEHDIDGYVGVLRGLREADPALPRRARQSVEEFFDIERQNRRLSEIYASVLERHT